MRALCSVWRFPGLVDHARGRPVGLAVLVAAAAAARPPTAVAAVLGTAGAGTEVGVAVGMEAAVGATVALPAAAAVAGGSQLLPLCLSVLRILMRTWQCS